MMDALIFTDLGTKVFTQYLDGSRSSLFTILTTPPTLGQPVILCKNTFSPIIRSTEDDFIRYTEDNASRIISLTPNPTPTFFSATRITQDNFVRITMDGEGRAAEIDYSYNEIITSLVSYSKLDCFLSNVDSYILKFA